MRSEPKSLRYWWEVAELTALGLVTRCLDALCLLPRPRLLLAYARLLIAHLRWSPYRWPRSFEAVRERSAAGQSEAELVYGETPVFSAWLLWRRAKLGASSRFVDLSAGRGRPLIGARAITAHVVGYELIEERASRSRAALARVGIELRTGDATAADLSGFDMAYVTWTGFSPALRERFEFAARTLPDGACLVTADAPVLGAGFREIRCVEAWCTWGSVPVWIYERDRSLDIAVTNERRLDTRDQRR